MATQALPLLIPQSVNDLIVGLYRYGREVPMARFQHWALEHVREVIDFDSALWRVGGETPLSVDSRFLSGQPPELMKTYVRDGWHASDFLHAECAANPGITFGITDVITAERWHDLPMYQQFARRFGIEWALCTHHVEPNLQLRTVISLWRGDPQRPFSAEDRMRKQLLTPHLVESMRINRFWHLATTPKPSDGALGPAIAVCDGSGRLHDCTGAFSHLLRAEWSGWAGVLLPPPLVAALGHGRFSGRGIDVDSEPFGDQWLLRARSSGLAARLGRRELQVATLYAQGLTYREIAGRLGVAPATVRNQLRASFAKLGVSSKIELSKRLGEADRGG